MDTQEMIDRLYEIANKLESSDACDWRDLAIIREAAYKLQTILDTTDTILEQGN